MHSNKSYRHLCITQAHTSGFLIHYVHLYEGTLKDKTLPHSSITVSRSFIVFRHHQPYLEINGEDNPGPSEDLLPEHIAQL
jgi:hypothetical protein